MTELYIYILFISNTAVAFMHLIAHTHRLDMSSILYVINIFCYETLSSQIPFMVFVHFFFKTISNYQYIYVLLILYAVYNSRLHLLLLFFSKGRKHIAFIFFCNSCYKGL